MIFGDLTKMILKKSRVVTILKFHCEFHLFIHQMPTETTSMESPKKRSRRSAQMRPFVADNYDDFIRDYLRTMYDDPTIGGDSKKMLEKIRRSKRLSDPLKYAIIRRTEAYIQSRRLVHHHCLFFRSREEINEYWSLMMAHNLELALETDAIYEGDPECPAADPFIWEFRANIDGMALYALIGEISLYDERFNIGFLYEGAADNFF
jgi:hypothetical protein